MSFSSLNIPQSGINNFNAYLTEQTKEAKPSEEYYHVNVVAEAYSKGFSDGKNSGKKEVFELILNKSRERFIEKANQVYLSAKSLVEIFENNEYHVEKIYLNVFHRNPKVLVVVKEELLLEDTFVEFAYTRIHSMQCSFHALFQNTLDLSLIGGEGLDEALLKADGFEYSEIF
jgi:hypothetical protein